MWPTNHRKTRAVRCEAGYLTEEENYWGEHHDTQSHVKEGTSFKHFAPAYRVGVEAATKYPGKEFHEIEDDVALD